MKIDEFRSIIWSHVMSGKKPSEIARETGRSKQTIFACCQAGAEEDERTGMK